MVYRFAFFIIFCTEGISDEIEYVYDSVLKELDAFIDEQTYLTEKDTQISESINNAISNVHHLKRH